MKVFIIWLCLLITAVIKTCHAQYGYNIPLNRPNSQYVRPNSEEKYKEIPIKDALRAIYTPPRDSVPIHEPQDDEGDPRHPQYNFHYPSNKQTQYNPNILPQPYQYQQQLSLQNYPQMNYQYVTMNHNSNYLNQYNNLPINAYIPRYNYVPPDIITSYQTSPNHNYNPLLEGDFRPSNFGTYHLNKYHKLNVPVVVPSKYTMKIYIPSNNFNANVYDIAKTLRSYISKRQISNSEQSKYFPQEFIFVNSVQENPYLLISGTK